MSAFVVGKATIDNLIRAGLRVGSRFYGRLNWVGDFGCRSLSLENADDVGKMLYRTNAESVAYRYSEPPEPVADLYSYEQPRDRAFEIIVALKLIDCYEYQSCEDVEAWDKSEAKAFCDALRRALVHMLPGYEEAPWGL